MLGMWSHPAPIEQGVSTNLEGDFLVWQCMMTLSIGLNNGTAELVRIAQRTLHVACQG
jgi:hypothetical protein